MPEPEGPRVDPDVSVVIPTLGRPILATALESIAEGEWLPAEVIIVDQSGDGTAERIVAGMSQGPLRIRCLASHGQGRAVGLNEGIRTADTPKVVITDDDCVVEPGWIKAMSDAIERSAGAIVTGRIEAWEGGNVPVVVTAREGFVQRRPRLTHDSLSGGNMGAERSTLERIGLFDEDPRTATAEDAELAYRALRAGVPIVYEPASGVAHVDWREGPAREAQVRSYALSHGAFYGRLIRGGDLFTVLRLAIHLVRAAKRWASGLITGDRERAMSGRSYLFGLPRGVARGWKRAAPMRGARTGAARVVVVMLTLDQKASTLRALESLQSEQGEGVDVLVWDNASEDGTADAVRRRYPQVLVHRSQENLGVAGGRNAAARLAIERFSPTHLLFLDNDMVVEPGFVRALLEPFRADPELAQTQAKLRFIDEPDLLNDGGGFEVSWWSGRTSPVGFREEDRGQRDEVRSCLPCGGATLTRVDVFEELDGFDEIFNPFGPEDLDFSLRVRRAGYRALYIPSAVAFHAVTTTFEGGRYTERYARQKARNWMILLRRHARLHQRLGFYLAGLPWLTLRMLFREGPRGGVAALRGWIRGVLARSSSPRVGDRSGE